MQVLNANDVNNNFTGFIDQVIIEKPLVVKQNRDYVLAMSKEVVMSLFADKVFNPILTEEDGIITATLQGFDLVVQGRNRAEVMTKLTVELIDYTQDYFNDFQLYYYSPNRQKHFPYIIKVLLADSFKQVEELLGA
jgi:antitoxin YefM